MSESSPHQDVSYPEIAAIVEALPILIRHTRRARSLSLREAAPLIGISVSTLHRIEQGADYKASMITPIIRWIGTP